MNEKDAMVECLKLLAEHEKAVSQLYLLYAEQFSDYQKFWSDLAEDKQKHAGWITSLNGGIYAGDITFKSDRFNLDNICSAIVYIHVQIDLTHRTEVSLMQAFATAVGIEETSLEKGFFEIFDGDAPQLQRILIEVRLSVADHCQKIRAQYEQIRTST